MNNTDTILSMTKHAGYVWPSYGITALVLVGLVVLSLRALTRTRAELEQIEAQIPRGADEA